MTKYEARLRDYGMLDSELSSVLADIDAEIARWKEDAQLWRQSENDCNKANRELEAEIAKLRKALGIAVEDKPGQGFRGLAAVRRGWE